MFSLRQTPLHQRPHIPRRHQAATAAAPRARHQDAQDQEQPFVQLWHLAPGEEHLFVNLANYHITTRYICCVPLPRAHKRSERTNPLRRNSFRRLALSCQACASHWRLDKVSMSARLGQLGRSSSGTKAKSEAILIPRWRNHCCRFSSMDIPRPVMECTVCMKTKDLSRTGI